MFLSKRQICKMPIEIDFFGPFVLGMSNLSSFPLRISRLNLHLFLHQLPVMVTSLFDAGHHLFDLGHLSVQLLLHRVNLVSHIVVRRADFGVHEFNNVLFHVDEYLRYGVLRLIVIITFECHVDDVKTAFDVLLIERCGALDIE